MAEAGITAPPTGNAPPPTDPIITDPPEGDPAATPPVQDWSDDWRSKMAGGDAKEAKRLERFASPKEVFKSYRAFETRLSSGELKSALPKDAKPEQLTAWRAENGRVVQWRPDRSRFAKCSQVRRGWLVWRSAPEAPERLVKDRQILPPMDEQRA